MDIIRAATTTCTAVLTDGMRQQGASPGETLDALLNVNISIVAYLVAESGMDIDDCAALIAHAIRKRAPNVVALYEAQKEETLQ